MKGTQNLAAILVADVVGYSQLPGADGDRTLVRLHGLRSDLVNPAIAAGHARIVKRSGDGSTIALRSVDAMRCVIGVRNGVAERNAGPPEDQGAEFRGGGHREAVEEEDGNLISAAKVLKQ
jgi:adenylate cyclase